MQQLELNRDYCTYVESSINAFFERYKQRFGTDKPIFVCVGAPKVPGDAIGPYVGSALLEMDPTLQVYGTTNKPVLATNANKIAKRLWIKTFFNRPIIAIDACIGQSAPGTIWCLESSGLKPGGGCGKDLEFIGNASIVVTTTNKPENLIEVDAFKIIKISTIIAETIYKNLNNIGGKHI